MNTVRVRRAHDIWPSRMDGRMDHKRRSVQHTIRPTSNDGTFMIDLDQIGRLDQGESETERIHPKGRGIDGIANGDVSRDAFVEAVFAEDAEGGSEAALEVLALFFLVIEDGRTAQCHFYFGFGGAGFLGVLRSLHRDSVRECFGGCGR